MADQQTAGVPDGWEVVAAPTAPPSTPTRGSGSSGASLALAAGGSPQLVRILDAAANSPAVPQLGSRMGQIAGVLGPIIGGGMESGLPGAMKGIAYAGLGAWKGGTPGYFTTKLGQQLLRPIAKGAAVASPYLQGLSTLGGASGVGDLAQMAEPNRQDIGFMGIGPSVNVPGAKPPALNALWQKITGQ